MNDSPWHFWKSWEGNPDRYPDKEPGDGLILGKAAHCLLLGDEVFDDLFIYVPGDAPRKPRSTPAADRPRATGERFGETAAKPKARSTTAPRPDRARPAMDDFDPARGPGRPSRAKPAPGKSAPGKPAGAKPAGGKTFGAKPARPAADGPRRPEGPRGPAKPRR